MSSSLKTVLITGASSGVGLATAVLLAKSNFKVYASLRNLEKAGDLSKAAEEAGVAGNIELVQLDITAKEEVIEETVGSIIKKAGKLDVLINNAGYSIAKPTEFTSNKEFREIFDTNFFGTVAVTKVIIPHMRANKSGHILNISSFGGLVGQPFNDAYCAAKFALSGWSESLHTTLNPFGVKVTLVCPGAITTPFLNKAVATSSTDPNSPYLPLQTAYMNQMKKVFFDNAASGIKSSQTAEEVAQVLLDVINDPNPHLVQLTSEYISGVAANKFKDVTGDTMANLVMLRSYGEKIVL